jgi:hypothetical protein
VTDRHPEAPVSTAWLAAHLADPDLRIFERTTQPCPAEPDDRGMSATMGLFLLHRLGHQRLALYDASMAGARDGPLPIGRG